MSYQSAIQAHLGDYARNRLGVNEQGTFRGKAYPHILPYPLKFLNFLEPVRAELQEHLKLNSGIKLHQFFHHLNSSQAFAFNLFYPYFVNDAQPARVLSSALGIDIDEVKWWQFEWIPDVVEGTNIDVAWRISEDVMVYCEVKLTEAEFSRALHDERHIRKLAEIYRPRLIGLVDEELLEEKAFFEHYQLLRNISYLSDRKSRLVILMPRENLALQPQLQRVLKGLNPSILSHVHIAYVEDVINQLLLDKTLTPDLYMHAKLLKEKYVL